MVLTITLIKYAQQDAEQQNKNMNKTSIVGQRGWELPFSIQLSQFWILYLEQELWEQTSLVFSEIPNKLNVLDRR
jgi:hypothetical protein